MPLTNERVMEKAHEFGFGLVGFAEAGILERETGNLEKWLSLGYHADMEYMARNFEKRRDVKEIFPDAKSVISLGMNYYVNESFDGKENAGKVSRYAWGKDYHIIMWEKLDDLIAELKSIDPEFEAVSYVDTGPVMDKAWAVRAGLGWMGKHSNIISKEIGSWFFIASIITNMEFEYSKVIRDFCGTCTACIDACPTDAIVSDKVVDANKCISYLTIENKKEIPDELAGKFEGWIFGCDICQDVCPWNKKFSLPTGEPGFHPHSGKKIDLEEIKNLTPAEFKKKFEVSPIKRAKLSGLKRNAEFLRKNPK